MHIKILFVIVSGPSLKHIDKLVLMRSCCKTHPNFRVYTVVSELRKYLAILKITCLRFVQEIIRMLFFSLINLVTGYRLKKTIKFSKVNM